MSLPVATDAFNESAIRTFRDCLQGKAEFYGSSLLGSRLLRQHGGSGRADDPGVHQESGAGRETTGADEISRALNNSPLRGFIHTTRSAGGS